jgi:hypothetical protein
MALVRRNIPHGDLRQQLLRWVRDTEHVRGDRIRPNNPDPSPRPPDGGKPRTGRRPVAVIVDAFEVAA